MITAPAASAAPTANPTFSSLVASAATRLDSRDYAVDLGLDEPTLLRYANGVVSMYERRCIEHVLVRNSWSRQFVVDLVKSRRRKRSAA